MVHYGDAAFDVMIRVRLYSLDKFRPVVIQKIAVPRISFGHLDGKVLLQVGSSGLGGAMFQAICPQEILADMP
ncbi:hypothetical protein WK22_00905 [Burkholderia multivorans]|nr:hypothetical protein WK22_00905 [Burkholderia multivorans]